MWQIPTSVMEASMKGVKNGVKFVNYSVNSGNSTYMGDRLQEELDRMKSRDGGDVRKRDPKFAGNAIRRLRNAALTKTSALPFVEDIQSNNWFPNAPKLEPGGAGLTCASNRKLLDYYRGLGRKAQTALSKEAFEFIPVDRGNEPYRQYYAPSPIRLGMFDSDEERARYLVERSRRMNDNYIDRHLRELESDAHWRRIKKKWSDRFSKEAVQYDSLGKMSSPAMQGGGVQAPMPQTNYAKNTLENEYGERLTKRQLAEMALARQQQDQNANNQSQSSSTTQNGTTTTTTTTSLSNSGLMSALSVGSTM